VSYVRGFRCTICSAEYGPDQVSYVCPKHGDEGILDVLYDYEAIQRHLSLEELLSSEVHSMWRYLPLLPVDVESTRDLVAGNPLASVGWTPLYPAVALATSLGLRELWIKDDTRQPTASFKDRASAIAVAKTRELGYEVVTAASTGNAAAALAGLCAAVGQRNVIFVPHTAPRAKVAQLLAYGATVLLVVGTYDQAFDLCLQAARAFGWYNRNTAYNPFMSEGKKTAAYEICEQLTGPACARVGLRAPDVIVVPVGDGCIIGGIHKGLCDLLALGWIEHMPRLIGVQAAGSCPLVDAWEKGREGWEMEPVEAHSVADSIVAGLPRDRNKALRAVRQSEGAFLRVSDGEILAAIPALARATGVFAEPAAAAAYAGLLAGLREGQIDADERVVILITGSGLKDVDSAIEATGQAPNVQPTLEAVHQVLEEQR